MLRINHYELASTLDNDGLRRYARASEDVDVLTGAKVLAQGGLNHGKVKSRCWQDGNIVLDAHRASAMLIQIALIEINRDELR
jgi:hypothetical protein